MTIHQISVFIENKKGTLLQIFNILKDADVQLISTTIADTEEYGILRILCNDPYKAHKVLRDNGVAAALSEVFALEMDKDVEKTAKIIECFTNENISLPYLYSFILNQRVIIVFRTDNEEKAKEVIVKNNIKHISESELAELF